MKILSIFLALLVSASSFADSNVRSVIDDLNYALKVEWDQNDMAFYNSQLDLYSQRLADLKRQGMSHEALIKEISGSIKNKQAAHEVEQMFRLISANDLSDDEAFDIYATLRDKTFVQGASWNGQVFIQTATIMAIVIGTAVVLYGISGRKLRKLQEDCAGGTPDAQTGTTSCERTPG